MLSTRVGKRYISSAISRPSIPKITNEPFKHYPRGSPERETLVKALETQKKQVVEIPCIVGGKAIYTGNTINQVMPSDHGHVLAKIHQADLKTVGLAMEAAKKAKADWASMDFTHRASIFLKAAELTATKHRAGLMATVMLGTGKTCWQAEIDAAVETIDFYRFNVKFAEEIYHDQPPENGPGTWNRLEYRPLEGFIWALSPFNFLAIGANLSGSCALMGNTVIHKPSTTAVLGNYYFFNILKEAGLPDGVINFLPGPGRLLADGLVNSPDFGGLHFTGSTETFNGLYARIANQLSKYKNYPRIVGETGGKNLHFIHASADIENVVHNTIRGAFEYQGQKCSAASRLYVPSNLWPKIKERLVAVTKELKVGQPDDFQAFLTAVIDRSSWKKIVQYIEDAKSSKDCEIIAGGTYNDSRGYFINPTIIVTKDPNYVTMREEIFGPVLTVYVYPEEKYAETLRLADTTAEFALTGSIFAQDRQAIIQADEALINACGNFYINDKSTGAVVGQQPFGGARASGTNDKAGSALNLLRWVSARTIKENFIPISSYRYPSME